MNFKIKNHLSDGTPTGWFQRSKGYFPAIVIGDDERQFFYNRSQENFYNVDRGITLDAFISDMRHDDKLKVLRTVCAFIKHEPEWENQT